jgi:aminoglycoside phosphotransferase family enzyme/predicted kinase
MCLMESAQLIQSLSSPSVYPEPTTEVGVHQTHISVVFVTDTFAYKIKKPLAFEFLDYSTLEKRRHWCEEEVRLNRRLAPSVYLGVVPIARDGPTIRVDGTGAVIEWAVKMVRLPEHASLASAVSRDEVSHQTVDLLARRIFDFHRHAERSQSIARFGRFDVVARNARENFDQSNSQVGSTVSRAVIDRLSVLTEEALGRLRGLVEERAARGVPCDGHGDLRLDHVYLFPDRQPPDDVVIVDAIEFNPRFRAADPVADMAFLVMDLIRHNRRDLAREFQQSYCAMSEDFGGKPLIPLYVSYRAAIRAKVNGLKASQPEFPADERVKAQSKARAHWLLALSALEEFPRQPCLVLVGGLPGTGKSTLSQALAKRASFDVIRSDEIRKELANSGGSANLGAPGAFGAGVYSPAWTAKTYHECLARADAALYDGKRVLVDATFRAESHRVQFLDLAAGWGVPAILFVCEADPLIVKSRLEQRRNDVSDADWSVYVRAAQQWEPLGARTEPFCRALESAQSESPPLDGALAELRRRELWL